jgi:hypothetical protein
MQDELLLRSKCAAFFKLVDSLDESIVHLDEYEYPTTTTTVATSNNVATVPSPYTSRKRTRPENTVDDQDIIVLSVVQINGDARYQILQHMIDRLNEYPMKGKRFRDSHTVELSKEDLIVTNQYANADCSSKPKCIICNSKIDKNAYRCKLNIVRKEVGQEGDDLCSTHVYCLSCYVVLESTVKPGHTPVCFGTCRVQRGGCRQSSKEDE